jgi:7-carboxy-7-deazaguanine synthase
LEKEFLINSIFLATEGEGVRVGEPQIFVRFQGCAVGCLNCDSKETWEFDQKMSTNLENIISRVEKLSQGKYKKINNVSITGGDPLHPKHTANVETLVRELKQRGYFVNIEASGTRVVKEIFDLVDFISFDYKTPSTGVACKHELLLKLFQDHAGKFQIKSVVADKKDFETSFEILNWLKAQLPEETEIPWVVTPCYNNLESFPQERFKAVIEMNHNYGGPFRVIGQQHKWIFGPDKTQV